MPVVDCLPFIILVFHFIDKWFLSKANLLPVYILTISGSLVTITYNILLLSELQGNHKSILTFCLSSTWTVAMSIKGLIRLYKKSKHL